MSMLSESLELQWLCKVNKHQLSDLIFLDEEVSFLKSLLDKYFSEKLPEVHVNRVQLIGEQLVHLNILKENITKDALTHQGNLHSQINNLLSKGVESLKLQNHRIEDEIRDLNKCFKNIKRDIFTIFKTTGIEEYQH